METNKIEEKIKEKCLFLADFLISKNRDYKSASFDLGLKGNVVHIWDKAKRYKNIVLDNHKPNNEKVEDTIRDIAGYAILGLIIFEEETKDNERK